MTLCCRYDTRILSKCFGLYEKPKKRRRVLSNNINSKSNPDQIVAYQIRIKDQFDSRWADWFEDLTITLENNGDTLRTGLVIDQAALHGLLKKVRDLGLTLLSVNPVEPDSKEVHDTNPCSFHPQIVVSANSQIIQIDSKREIE